jgi:ubiquinone/menaquinone biosynthesis C-methylase UbiE
MKVIEYVAVILGLFSSLRARGQLLPGVYLRRHLPKTKSRVEEKKREIEGYKEEGRSYGWDGSFEELNRFAFQKMDLSWQNALKVLDLKGDKIICDFGAGRCWASYAFSKMGYNVIALDMNTDRVVGLGAGTTLARKGRVSFGRVAGDCEMAPFKNASFDIIFGHQILHHATDLNRMLGEVFRILKKGGIFVATGEHKRGIFTSEKRWRKKNLSVAFGANEHLYSYFEYRNALKKAGFREINVGETKGYCSLEETVRESKSHAKMIKVARALVKLPLVNKLFHSPIAYKLALVLFTFDIRIVAKK